MLKALCLVMYIFLKKRFPKLFWELIFVQGTCISAVFCFCKGSKTVNMFLKSPSFFGLLFFSSLQSLNASLPPLFNPPPPHPPPPPTPTPPNPTPPHRPVRMRLWLVLGSPRGRLRAALKRAAEAEAIARDGGAVSVFFLASRSNKKTHLDSVVQWHQLFLLFFFGGCPTKNGLPQKGVPFFPGSLNN